MENDVNTGQVITGQSDANANTSQGVSQPATGTDVPQPVTGQDTAGVQQVKEQAVPYERFKEVNEKAKTAQAEIDNLKLQMQILQSNRQPQTPAQVNLFEEICKEKGYNEDYLTKSQQAEVTQAVINRQVGQLQSQIQMQSFVTQNPDYSEVVGTTDAYGNFQIAPPLARQLKNNPMLLQALQTSPHRHILAYQIAKSDPEYITTKTQTQTTNAAITAEKLLSQSAMKSIGNVPGAGNLDKANMMRTMSPDEFQAYKDRIKAGA